MPASKRSSEHGKRSKQTHTYKTTFVVNLELDGMPSPDFDLEHTFMDEDAGGYGAGLSVLDFVIKFVSEALDDFDQGKLLKIGIWDEDPSMIEVIYEIIDDYGREEFEGRLENMDDDGNYPVTIDNVSYLITISGIETENL